MTTQIVPPPPAIRPDPAEHPHRRPTNLAATVARFSARHRFLAVGGWLLFVALATALMSTLGTRGIEDGDRGNGESRRAGQIIADAGFDDRAGELVVVHSDSLAVTDPAFKDAVTGVLGAVNGTGAVENVKSPLDPAAAAALVSQDKHSALVTFDITGDPDTATERVGPILDAVAGAQRAHPDLYVGEMGDASIQKMFDDTLGTDMQKLSMLSIPITLGILIVAFGALLAAFLPLGLALTAFLGSLGLLAVASRWAPTEDTVTHLMLLMGLAVGVDYCLFYIRREREERRRGADPDHALEIAAATSGRSVLISAMTVIIAMAGMFLTRDATFVSLAVGTILVVATAAVGSMTVLPAILSKLGDRVDLGRIPGLRRSSATDGGRFWRAVMRTVLRRPGISAALAAGALVALALPALGMRTAEPGLADLSHDRPALVAYDTIQAAFPGGADPARVVLKAPDVTAAPVTAAIGEFRERALATGELHEPIKVEVNPDKTVAVISVGLSGDGTDAASERAVTTLRSDVIPQTLAAIPGSEVAVTGHAADSVDFNDALDHSVPLVFGFVLGLAFLLLLVSFRSLTVAVTAIVLNLLSVAAAYGLLTVTFQQGWGEHLLGFTSIGAVTNWLPLFLFVILFGLSMDYHVFVLSRIREGHDRGWPNRLAVSRGIRGTAGVITSAAVVMVAVFGLFATGSLTTMKAMGFGLGAAVLIDATIVRAVLLPAVMAMLGERNWYLPRWLRWLPHPTHH